MISFTAADAVPAATDVLGVPVTSGRTLGTPSTAAEIDRKYLAARGFEGKVGETLPLPAEDGTVVVAVGVGPAAAIDAEVLRRAAAAFTRSAWKSKRLSHTLLDAAPASLAVGVAAQAVVEGGGLAGYKFGDYKAAKTACAVKRITVVGGDRSAVKAGVTRGASIVEWTSFARDLVNEPPSSMTPAVFADRVVEAIGEGGGSVSVEVWDEERCAAERLGGLLGVARGSDEPPRMLRFVYEPPTPPESTLALVGKGVTFDSGGLSIKTVEGMKTMKTDMSGAAAVAATFGALAQLGGPRRVIGYAPLTENMSNGRAVKPGDVLRIRNGKTVEVLNTDAEGRLILADGLSLAVEDGVDAIVDVATLTGACVVALGREIAGLFVGDEALGAEVEAAAARSGEAFWRMPLHDRYRKHIDSEVADMKNEGSAGQAGATAAALFLREFVGGTPWCHLDIAGPARAEADDAYLTKGGTAFSTRTLIELVT